MSALETQIPLLLRILCSFLFHFPTEICARFSSLKTKRDRIETLACTVCKMVSIRGRLLFFGNLTKVTAVIHYFSRTVLCGIPTWQQTLTASPYLSDGGGAKALQRGSLHTDVTCSAASRGPAYTWERSTHCIVLT